MSLGKRSVGLLLVGLGAIGILVCLAGIAGVWIAASRLQQVNSRVFRQVDQFVVQVKSGRHKPAMPLAGHEISSKH